MAATNSTQHFGLNQWEATDPFLRVDFNADNSAIDAALYTASQAAETAAEDSAFALALARNTDRTVYNMLLQDYYEGKYTGYKKALMFDGFMDASNITSLSFGAWRDASVKSIRANDRVYTQQVNEAAAEYSISNNTGNNFPGIGSFTPPGLGSITKVTIQAKGANTSVRLKVTTADTDGNAVEYTAPGATSTSTLQNIDIYLNPPVAVYPGAQVSFGINCVGGSALSNVRWLTADVAQTQHAPPALTVPPVSPGQTYDHLLGYVHHNGGDVTPSFTVGGTAYAMTLLSTGDAVTVDQHQCTEDVFELTLPAGTEAAAVLTLTFDPDGDMSLYDYGFLFL